MKKIIRLTESDLTRIVKRIIKENESLSFKGSFEPIEFLYNPGMGEIAPLDNINKPISSKRGRNEDVYNRFVNKFENDKSDFDYIELEGGRYDMDSKEFKKILMKIKKFVTNPSECTFLNHPMWLRNYLRSTDKLYIVKYYGDLFGER